MQDVISKGHELIVQVEKDERDNKGASLTTYLSIPGRYIVMMPGQEKVGVSRKIEDREDRGRLKEIFNSLKLPKKMGFILRAAGSDKTEEDLDNDLKYLTKLWAKIQAESKKVHAPALIYKEQDFAVKTVRDYLTSDVDEVLIDDPEAFKNTKEFLRKTVPWRKINISLYKDRKPIYACHNIEAQIAKIHERFVYLPSRGYIVIDKTEALTAIDVNSGRSRKEEHIEATALKTNLEAADEIARQLRFRDLGGLVVIDFIDMEPCCWGCRANSSSTPGSARCRCCSVSRPAGRSARRGRACSGAERDRPAPAGRPGAFMGAVPRPTASGPTVQ